MDPSPSSLDFTLHSVPARKKMEYYVADVPTDLALLCYGGSFFLFAQISLVLMESVTAPPTAVIMNSITSQLETAENIFNEGLWICSSFQFFPRTKHE